MLVAHLAMAPTPTMNGEDPQCHRVSLHALLTPVFYMPHPGEDLRTKLQDLEKLQQDIRDSTRDRGTRLQDTLGVAEKFRRDFQDAIQSLRDIQDNLVSQDSPGVDPATVKEQQKELQVWTLSVIALP